MKTVLLLSIAIIVLLVVGVLVYLKFNNKLLNERDAFILTGLSNSGKTTLFTLLRTGLMLPTHTSLKSNEALVRPVDEEGEPLTEKMMKIIDVPGHDKLRAQLINKYENSIKGIVFMIDAFSATRNIIKVSEALYDILSQPFVIENSLPILIIANKSDLATSISIPRLKSLLESEIDKQRESKSSSLMESLGEENEEQSNVFLGYENKKFEFTDLNTNSVDFLSLSLGSLPKTKDGKNSVNYNQLREILNWTESC
ncbi:P-loop containing nucleoside triphosphate hydrolase protein [Neoconidiobolus thromboides FSU 785]|nr:P-loop containing nucleoside triphosphate hydrolase protein [Neoconidiobolus thromboides FSU 785]